MLAVAHGVSFIFFFFDIFDLRSAHWVDNEQSEIFKSGIYSSKKWTVKYLETSFGSLKLGDILWRFLDWEIS